MGVIQVTRRPYYYAQLEKRENEMPLPEPDGESTGTLSFQFSVGGISGSETEQRRKLMKTISSVLREKGQYIRERNDYGTCTYYEWKKMAVSNNTISTRPFEIAGIESVLELMKKLDEQGWFPNDEIVITYHPTKPDMMLLLNLQNILESRRLLIEEALSLTEPFMIIVADGMALSITLSAFSYTAIEAAAYLIEQACKMAQSTGRSRMKPCDMTNPKFQMRSWLLRLGFIGEQFERPRKTLLEGLSGDAAFFREEQKNQAIARRKARSMNGGIADEPV